jgi:hypothetical protein
MKRITILIGISLLFCHFAFSQVKPFRFGLKLAPNVGWISPDSEDYEKDGSVPGFSWGFISDFTITENYSVGTGFNVSYLKGKMKYPYMMDIVVDGDTTLNVPGSLQRQFNLQYIELPVTLKMKTNKFNALQVYGQIGFSLGFNVKAKAEDVFSYEDAEDNYMSENDEPEISDEITLLKGALVLGGGIEYYVDESTSIVVGVTFSNGLSNILKGYNTADPGIQQKANISYVELTLGVIF